jgi:hypothetical protein
MTVREFEHLGRRGSGLVVAIGLVLAWMAALPFWPGLTPFTRGKRGPGKPVTLRCRVCGKTDTYKLPPPPASPLRKCKNEHSEVQRDELP